MMNCSPAVLLASLFTELNLYIKASYSMVCGCASWGSLRGCQDFRVLRNSTVFSTKSIDLKLSKLHVQHNFKRLYSNLYCNTLDVRWRAVSIIPATVNTPPTTAQTDMIK